MSTSLLRGRMKNSDGKGKREREREREKEKKKKEQEVGNYVRGLIDTHATIISRIGRIMRGKFNTCVSETSDIEISR